MNGSGVTVYIIVLITLLYYVTESFGDFSCVFLRETRQILQDPVRTARLFELIRVSLRSYLIEELGIAEPPNSPKPVLRMANENHLFASSIDQWLRYADARIDTAHDYDGEKAKTCLKLVPDFIDDAIDLYQTISRSKW